jgi:3-oxoacyl-[acyl-carrier protein] reductase
MSECDSFLGSVAVVTGGSRGIGAGIAFALAECGAKVVVTGRDRAALDRVARSITEAGGTVLAVPAELTDEAAVLRLRTETERVFGVATLVAACAGGGGEPKPLLEDSVERWRATLETNLTSAFLTLRVFLPAMIEARKGAVVMMSSSAGRQLSGASASYAAAKAGLQSLMRQAAAEAAPNNVRVNAVAPSAIITDRLAAAPASVRDAIGQGFPLRRMGTVADVVEATLFLLSGRSRWITGTTLDVTGGRVML